jgi:hypothetical protein
MKKELRDRERELYKSSFELRNFDLSKAKYEDSAKIRKKQNEDWHRYLFFKGCLEQLEKEKKKDGQ